MPKKTIRDIELSNKRVLVRVDFNVPLDDKDGTMVITDATRIQETLPTIKYLIEKGAKVILCSHLGRPKGQRDPKQSLAPVAPALSELLGCPVEFSEETTGEMAKAKAMALPAGGVLLLENTRFHAGEEKNDPELAKGLADLAEVFVNDAFGSAHRAHSSTAGVADYLPAVSGLLMEKELTYLHDELENPARPFVVILGGAKVSDKIGVINRLLEKADTIIIGGGMAYTFKKTLEGMEIGTSLYDPEGAKIVAELMEKAKEKGVKIHLPVDFICTEKFAPDADTQEADDKSGIPVGWMGLDIGPKTRAAFAEVIARAKTIIWNGPAGVFEFDRFAEGTKSMAAAVASATAGGAISVVGGGDTATAAKKFHVADKVTHCSTGGGASLELLEGKALPGVTALDDKG